MKETKLGSDITPDEKVCYNCKHLAWMIGIGQGLRCIHPKKGNSEMIPSSKHTCELFEKNPKLEKPDKNES
jgi:hypothetical protein